MLFQTPAQIIQWREKDLSTEENRVFLAEGVELSSRTGKVFLINSDLELALQEGLSGAHLTSRQNLETAVRMREESGLSQFILGKSVHSVAEAILAERQGADYLLLAPIFDPISKAPYTRALGVEVLRAATDAVLIPIFALGGVTEQNTLQVVQAGASGVAGISWMYPHLSRVLEDRIGD